MRVPLEWLKEYVDLEGVSPKEIGDAFTQIGLMLDKPFDGKVFDLEHRFDRSDWLSILGCARDLAAFLARDLKLPETYTEEGKIPAKGELVDIRVECPDAVNRFNTRVFRNITVKSSPAWLKNRLEEYGIPPINNIVDITNYVMVEVGQPMHAQDLAKFRKNSSGGDEIVIRKAYNEEKIVTFLGDEVTLYPEAFVLTQNGVATVLGGIVGGRETGVDENTKNIVLDAGNYNQNIVRKVSRKLKIQNETVLRYDKFLHPDLTQYALERATYLILKLAGGEYYQNIDWNPKPQISKKMVLKSQRLRQISGFDVNPAKATDILTRLGYSVNRKHKPQNKVENSEGTKEYETDWELELAVPYFRTDVEVEDDIVSDILRINGYSKIPTKQIESAPPKEITPETYKLEETLRDCMTRLGAHEHITDPLVASVKELSLNENPTGKQVALENSQNSQKDALRTNVAQTLAEIVPNYMKNKIYSGALFEIGKVYTQTKDEKTWDSYKETKVLECLVFDKNRTPKEIHQTTSALLGGLLQSLGAQKFNLNRVNSTEASILVDKKQIGTIRYNGFTLITESLATMKRKDRRVLSDIIEEKSIELSIIIPKTTPVGRIISALAKESVVSKVQFIEEYAGKEIGDQLRSISLKIIFQDTLKDADMKEFVASMTKKLKDKFRSAVRLPNPAS